VILFVRFYFHELKYSIDVEMYAQYVQCSTSWMLVLAGASLTYSDLGSDGAPTNYDFLPVAKLAKARDCNGKHKVILRSGVRLAPGRSLFFVHINGNIRVRIRQCTRSLNQWVVPEMSKASNRCSSLLRPGAYPRVCDGSIFSKEQLPSY
jgi:hypothetical protein